MEEKEMFRGHLDECFKNFTNTFALHAFSGSHKAVLVKKGIAEFCGVKPLSVANWIKGVRPTGGSLIKLMCYLEVMNYRVIELERMPKVKHNFAELIGFGIFSGEQAVGFLGYNSVSRLYEILRGDCGIGSVKEQKMWDVWKEKKEELERKKKEASELYCGYFSLESNLKTEETKIISKLSFSISHQAAVIKIVEGLLVLLEEESLNGFSEKNFELAKIALRLSTRLSTLGYKWLIALSEKGTDGRQGMENVGSLTKGERSAKYEG